ncbi:hypothetical protein L1987_27408 [Smallanthus sonchifolius]|uniref:Uncharacterized protein n=1 Tax=Smallanthus sonchifolius TaxID=185202 RepID=A0ACB9ICL6_9ASTR|nr:hypothetical protein L1987_27408 [Smallanthus sonchifolius]
MALARCPWRYFHRRLKAARTAFPLAFQYNSPSLTVGPISISLALDLSWVPARALGKKGDHPTDLAR